MSIGVIRQNQLLPHYAGEMSKTGAPGEIRTPGPQIRSLVLYPAELRAPDVIGALARPPACHRRGIV